MISQDIYELPNVQTNFWETYGVHRIQQKLWITFFFLIFTNSLMNRYLNRNLYFDLGSGEHFKYLVNSKRYETYKDTS